MKKMKVFSISEAIVFLLNEYGEENMPTSEETLRRAIRTKKLIAQEDGVPGRKGYSITENDLRAYAEDRLKMSRKRKGSAPANTSRYVVRQAEPADNKELVQFPDLFARYISKEIPATTYYKLLFSERIKWENAMHDKQELLAQLNTQIVVLQNDIQSCQSAIEAYSDGISKFRP